MGIEELCFGVVTKKGNYSTKLSMKFVWILSNIQDPTANDIPSLVSWILATSEYQLCSQNNRFNVSLQKKSSQYLGDFCNI